MLKNWSAKINSFFQEILSTSYMSGTVPDADNVKNVQNSSVLVALIILWRGQSTGKFKK